MPHRYLVPVPAAAGAPLDQARAAFDWLTCGPHPVAVDGRVVAGMPARPVRLDELRDRLQDRRCPGVTRDAVWALLVHRARVDAGVWTIACVGCALPTLVGISRQLCRGLAPTPTHPHGPRRRRPVAGVPDHPDSTGLDSDSEHPQGGPGAPAAGLALDRWRGTSRRGMTTALVVGDIEAAILSGFLGELAVLDLTQPRVWGRLRSAAHEAGVLAKREMARAPLPRAQLFASGAPPAPARHPDLVLARAVAAGAITRNEAVLIGSTRLEPISLADVAVLRGQSYRDVRAARIRAERKLSVFLREQDTGPIDLFLSRTTTPRSPTCTRSSAGVPDHGTHRRDGNADDGGSGGGSGGSGSRGRRPSRHTGARTRHPDSRHRSPAATLRPGVIQDAVTVPSPQPDRTTPQPPPRTTARRRVRRHRAPAGTPGPAPAARPVPAALARSSTPTPGRSHRQDPRTPEAVAAPPQPPARSADVHGGEPL